MGGALYLSLSVTLAAFNAQGIDVPAIEGPKLERFQAATLANQCRTDEQAKVLRHGNRKRRRVALTFDDGPNRATTKIVKVLRKRGIRATFFVVGRLVDRHPSTLRITSKNGHIIANHSYTHSFLRGDTWKVGQEIDSTSQRIRAITGLTPCLFRSPYGRVTRPLVKATSKRGMRFIQWDVDTLDWRNGSTSSIVKTALSQVRPGSIILMHDTYATAKALPDLIKALKRRHYRFTTVDQITR